MHVGDINFAFNAELADLWKAVECESGGMVYALDSESSVRKDVGVQVPSLALYYFLLCGRVNASCIDGTIEAAYLTIFAV